MIGGLLLAAGAGTRMGRPKALMSGPDGVPWLHSATAALLDGGCDTVTVVLGARADEARSRVPGGTDVVVADDWARGLSASLRAGLVQASGSVAEAVVVHLVDLPDVGAPVIRRLLAAPGTPDATTLRRAGFDGSPGHPVVIGRAHWPELIAGLEGDQGARSYLSRHAAQLVECGDLATGRDVDHPGAGAPDA